MKQRSKAIVFRALIFTLLQLSLHNFIKPFCAIRRHFANVDLQFAEHYTHAKRQIIRQFCFRNFAILKILGANH